jgi:hypothetical protein
MNLGEAIRELKNAAKDKGGVGADTASLCIIALSLTSIVEILKRMEATQARSAPMTAEERKQARAQ